ncbi:nucleoside phosphatase family-domain-containing protein [Lyophyllum atratum]|nr:nucleoside phosphatase family-domain-containing protein [Lyophyllum atratum]
MSHVADLLPSVVDTTSSHAAADPVITTHYAAIIDSGSSGSRLFIYEWKGPFDKNHGTDEKNLLHIKEIFTTTTKKTSGQAGKVGGIQHVKTIEAMRAYLGPLIDTGVAHLAGRPGARDVPLYLMATAGLRKEEQAEARRILDLAHDVMHARRMSAAVPIFDVGVQGNEDARRTHTMLLTGEEEGLLAWTALNYGRSKYDRVVGLHEMGGASIQMAYSRQNAIAHTREVCLPSKATPHHVISSSWIGYGADDIEKERLELLKLSGWHPYIDDDCLPLYRIIPMMVDGKEAKRMGTGNFYMCYQSAKALFEEKARKTPFDMPPYASVGLFADSEYFLGVSNYWFTYMFFGAGGKYGKDLLYNPKLFLESVSDYCGHLWGQRKVHYDDFTDAQCFKAAWMTMLLHHPRGFGLALGSKTEERVKALKEQTWKGVLRFPEQVELASRSTWTIGAASLIAREKKLQFCPGGPEMRFPAAAIPDEMSYIPPSYNITPVASYDVENLDIAYLLAPGQHAVDSNSPFGRFDYTLPLCAAIIFALLTLAYRHIRSARRTVGSISLPTSDMKSVV